MVTGTDMKKMNNIVLISAASILGFTACNGPAQ